MTTEQILMRVARMRAYYTCMGTDEPSCPAACKYIELLVKYFRKRKDWEASNMVATLWTRNIYSEDYNEDYNARINYMACKILDSHKDGC